MASADADPLLPQTNSPVTLVVDDERVRAYVLTIGGGRVELDLVSVPQQLRQSGSTDAALEYVAERGPARLLGEAILVPRGEDERRPRVRFTHQAPSQLLLRRDRVRAPVEFEIEVESAGVSHRTKTVDLRGGGALVRGPISAELGQGVRYRLRVPGRGDAIEGDARVARLTDDGHVAIHFGPLDEDEVGDIMLAVFEARRAR